MARIRTIKPDFWTDEKMVECSPSARLLFIGLLNFSDDNGNLQRSAKKIKMQIFPADAIDCEPLLLDLINQGVLLEYSVDGESYLNIKNFRKHQVINRPSKSGIPLPPITDDSVNDCRPIASDSLITHGMLTDGKEGNGIGKDINTFVDAKASPSCPHLEIIELYNQTLPELQAVIPDRWSGARAKHLQARWRESPKHQSLDFWRKFFTVLRNYGWYLGQNDRGWRATLGWIVEKKNFDNLVEKFVSDSRRAGTAL